jgi:hypothetical protein
LDYLQALPSTANPPHDLPPIVIPDLGVVQDANHFIHRGMQRLQQAEIDFQEAGYHMQRIAMIVKQLQTASPPSAPLLPPLNDLDDLAGLEHQKPSPSLHFLPIAGLVNPVVYSSSERNASSLFESEDEQ